MARAGFVILTNQSGDQLLRLTQRLGQSFDDAAIACHHDFGQCPLDTTRFGSHVRFVRPHVATAWGDFSLVTATLAAMRLLVDRDDPDYITLLSGADYPLKRGPEIMRDLESARADAFCELHLVCPFTPADPPVPHGWPHRRRETLRRYYRITWPLPRIFGPRYFLWSNRWATRLVAPYSKSFRCFAGPQWMTLGRRAAHTVLEWHARNPWLEDYLRPRPTSIADESYIHTILGNATGLTIDQRNFRFYDWQKDKMHPQVLTMEHMPHLLASPAHFGRKFAPDSPMLDALDAWLDHGVAMPASLTTGSDTAGRYTS